MLWNEMHNREKCRQTSETQTYQDFLLSAQNTEASPHKRELKCDTKHQSQEADATFITSDGS